MMRRIAGLIGLWILLTACTLKPDQPDRVADTATQTPFVITMTPQPTTATSTPIPTTEPAPTALPTQARATRVPTQTNCTPRADWTGTYTVVANDTLGVIARNYGTTAATLAQANCLGNTQMIYVGQSLRVPNGQPSITAFASSASSASYQRVSRREERLPVTWIVINRPDTANLAFEQVLVNGTVQNVELPRNNPWVNSSGEGVVSPMLPGGENKQIRLRLRLFDMATNNTLATREITLPLIQGEPDPGTVYDGDQCYAAPFAGGNPNIRVGDQWRVRQGFTVPVFATAAGTTMTGELGSATIITIEEGPYCILRTGSTVGSRRWRVKGVQVATAGWIEEYLWNTTDTVDHMLEPNREIVAFDVQPRTVKSGDPITITWTVKNVSWTNIYMNHTNQRFPWSPLEGNRLFPANGSITVNAPEYVTSVQFSLIWADPNPITVTINCRDQWWVNPANYTMCAAAPMQTAQAAYQTFENGFMIWSAADKRIYVFGRYGQLRDDTWSGQAITWAETPPEGKFLPQNGFGWVWINDRSVREAVGWATGAEQGYTMQYQHSPSGLGTGAPRNYYMTLPDGRIVPFITSLTALSYQTPVAP